MKKRHSLEDNFLQDLQEDRIPDGLVLPSFNELQGIIGFPEYFEEAEKYSTKGSTAGTNASSSGSPSATNSTQGAFSLLAPCSTPRIYLNFQVC